VTSEEGSRLKIDDSSQVENPFQQEHLEIAESIASLAESSTSLVDFFVLFNS